MKHQVRKELLNNALCLVDEDILARVLDARPVAVSPRRRTVHLFGRSMSVAAAVAALLGLLATTSAVVVVSVPLLTAAVKWLRHLPPLTQPPSVTDTAADESDIEPDTESESEDFTESDPPAETQPEPIESTVTPIETLPEDTTTESETLPETTSGSIVDELYDTIPFRDAVIHHNGTGEDSPGRPSEWLASEYATHLFRSVAEIEAAGLYEYLDPALYTDTFFRENTLLVVQQMRSSNGYELLELTDLAVIDGQLYPVLTWRKRGDYAGSIVTHGVVTAHIRNSDLPEGIAVPQDWALNRILDQDGETRYDDSLDFRDFPLAPSEVEDQVSFVAEAYETVAFRNPQIIRRDDAFVMGNERAVVIESYEDLLRYDPETTYTQDFFEDNVLLLVRYKGRYDYIGECVQSLVGLAVMNGRVHPVLSLYLNLQTAQTEMSTYITAEIRREDLSLPLGKPYIIVTAVSAYNPDHYKGGFDAFPLTP